MTLLSRFVSSVLREVIRRPNSSHLCAACRQQFSTKIDAKSSDDLDREAEDTEQEIVEFRSRTDRAEEGFDTDRADDPILWDRTVPRSFKEFNSIAKRPFQQLLNPRILRVSIIGSPNAGKSTLTNQIIGWRVSSVSQKVHTTRKNTLAVMTDNNVQIILVDTPGVISMEHGKKHHLERSLIVDPEASLNAVDVIAVIADVSLRYTQDGLDPLVLSMLYRHPLLDSILILNKVDLLTKKSKLLELCRTLTCGVVDGSTVPRNDNAETFLSRQQKDELFARRFQESQTGREDPETNFWEDVDKFEKIQNNVEKKVFLQRKKGWPRFKEVFMISALNGDGTQEIKNYFMRTARLGDWRFHPSMVSNQSPKDIALMAVREKLLDHLRMKLPYQIELFMKEWSIDEKGTLRITVKVKCPRKGAMKHVMGENGSRVRQIAYEAGQEMMNTFRCEVLLKLVVAY